MSHRDMSDVTRIQYLRSEITVPPVIYEAATHIFSAYVSANQLNENNQEQLMEKSVKLALELAITTEKVIAKSGSVKAGL